MTPLQHYPPGSATTPAIVVAKTKEDLLGPGSIATAVVAPKSGDIPVLPGTPVIGIAKSLRNSPAFQKLWKALCAAWAVFWLYVLGYVVVAGGPFKLDQSAWLKLLQDATYPAVVSIALAYGLKVKMNDNDPIVNASLRKDT